MRQHLKLAFEFIERIEVEQDQQRLIGAYQDFIERLSFRAFCAGRFTLRRNDETLEILGTTWPEEWNRRYAERSYNRADPVAAAFHETAVPFDWARLRARAEGLPARIMDEGRDFGFCDGFGFGIHHRGPFISGISLGSQKVELSPEEARGLHLASIFFEAKLEQLHFHDSAAKRVLSKRERECLSWVAEGKGDWEISQILTVSEITVTHYVKNAMKKLNATKRTQAVVVAILNKEIIV